MGRVYDRAAHRRLREQLIEHLPMPCARCGRTIPYPSTPELRRRIHLDHVGIAVALGGAAGEGALSHGSCDAAAGPRVRVAMRQARTDRALAAWQAVLDEQRARVHAVADPPEL